MEPSEVSAVGDMMSRWLYRILGGFVASSVVGATFYFVLLGCSSSQGGVVRTTPQPDGTCAAGFERKGDYCYGHQQKPGAAGNPGGGQGQPGPQAPPPANDGTNF